MKTQIRRIQAKLGVAQDGIVGPKTLAAMSRTLGLVDVPHWPTQSEVRKGTSRFGHPGNEALLTHISPPYTLYYEGRAVSSIRVHQAIALHVQQALREVLAHYGEAEIERLGLNQFGGCYNYRSTTGGKTLSMHAWGIALDFAPADNAYKVRAPRASLSCKACEPWWEIWESHGAVSMGREKNYDWMHVQFARL